MKQFWTFTQLEKNMKPGGLEGESKNGRYYFQAKQSKVK